MPRPLNSQLARSMVTKWGFSERMGPLLYDEDDGEVFLGMSAASQPKPISSQTAREIDEETRRIIDECYGTAKSILEEHRDQLESMAEALIEFETLMPEQADDIMEGRPPRPVEVASPPPRPAPAADAEKEPGKEQEPRPTPPIGGPAEEH